MIRPTTKPVGGKAFIQLHDDRKVNLKLESAHAPTRWQTLQRSFDDAFHTAMVSCKCLFPSPKPPPQEDTHHPSLWHILPQLRHDLDLLATVILWSKEGPIPVLVDDNGTIADLKRAITLQLWISPRLDVQLLVIDNNEEVLDRVEAGDTVPTKATADSEPIKRFTYVADGDDTLQLSVFPKTLKDVLSLTKEPVRQVRVRSSDLKQRRGIIVRPVGPTTTIGEIKEALLNDAPRFFAPVPDPELSPLNIHFLSGVVYPDVLMENKSGSIVEDNATIERCEAVNDDILFLDFKIPKQD